MNPMTRTESDEPAVLPIVRNSVTLLERIDHRVHAVQRADKADPHPLISLEWDRLAVALALRARAVLLVVSGTVAHVPIEPCALQHDVRRLLAAARSSRESLPTGQPRTLRSFADIPGECGQ